MKIPKYVQNLMARSCYEYDRCRQNEEYAAGYTIRIRKATWRTLIGSFQKEIDKLVAWGNRVAGEKIVIVLSIPKKTHYDDQFAIVTIYDPVMQVIEKYIPKEGK